MFEKIIAKTFQHMHLLVLSMHIFTLCVLLVQNVVKASLDITKVQHLKQVIAYIYSLEVQETRYHLLDTV